MWPVERLHTQLIIKRLSQTRSRDEVYLALGRLGPISRADLAWKLAEKMDKRTVYRTIKTFLVAQIAYYPSNGLVELSPPFRHRHYYIVCTGCSRRTGFWDEALETKLNRILERHRYTQLAQQVELSGLCRQCTELSSIPAYYLKK